jgi:hypothetical protein
VSSWWPNKILAKVLIGGGTNVNLVLYSKKNLNNYKLLAILYHFLHLVQCRIKYIKSPLPAVRIKALPRLLQGVAA